MWGLVKYFSCIYYTLWAVIGWKLARASHIRFKLNGSGIWLTDMNLLCVRPILTVDFCDRFYVFQIAAL